MSLVREYLVDEVEWIPAQRNEDGTTKKDGSGRVLYGEAKTIKAKLVERYRLIRDRTGKEIVSSSHAVVLESVQIDDKINGRIVESVTTMKDLAGEPEGRTVYLK